MDSFFDEEADVGSSSDDGGSLKSGIDEDEDERPKKKKEVKKKKRRVAVESDDDEEDGEDLDQDLPGLINDNVESEEEGSDQEGGAGSGSEGGKRRHESDIDEDLEDEDYDLLEENLGYKIERHKRRRIKRVSDDEDEEEPAGETEDGKHAIETEIFGEGADEEDDDYSDKQSRRGSAPAQQSQDIEELEGSEESDVDDFIVDEEGKSISVAKKKRRIIHDDAALQEAQDIFGVDVDLDDFDRLSDEYDEEEQDDDYDQDVEEDEEARPKPGKQHKKKTHKKPINQIYEPVELEQFHLTDFDQEVRMTDMPERFQLRSIPVCPTEEGELEEEAEWIYRQAFSTPPLSRQDYFEQEGRRGHGHRASKGPTAISKIREALNLMRNQKFEIPFIAFYRKEHIDPELTIKDLWTVYMYDEKWMQLRKRKQKMIQLYEQMQQYQFEQIDRDKPLESHVRTLTDDDVDRVRSLQTMEKLQDEYQFFVLYYGNDVSKMKLAMKAAKKKQREQQRLEGEDVEMDDELDDEADTMLKHAPRKSGYTMCINAGLADLARKFGLSAEQFGENLRDNYQRHDVDQDPAEPLILAEQYISRQFPTAQDVLNGARHVVAMQIAHDPVVRECVRQTFRERAKITVRPTKKGLKEIDESHNCFTFKYLKNKPVQELSEDHFLKISQAEKDQLLTYEIHIDEKDNPRFSAYLDDIQPLFHKDEYSNLVQEWNKQRSMALERCMNQLLYPLMIREIKTKLLDEAKQCIIQASCFKLYEWLKVAPYQVDEQIIDDDDYSATSGIRVMGIAYSTEREEVSFCAVVDGDGEVTDFLRLPHIMKRKNGWNREDAALKLYPELSAIAAGEGHTSWDSFLGLDLQFTAREQELIRLKDFIGSKKPHVIAIGAASREATTLAEDLKLIVEELEQEQQMSLINVELVDDELACVFANSRKAEQEMREYPTLLRQAVSLARRLQDPLIEFAQLCNADEDILSLRYHPLQDAVKEELLELLYLEFVNRVNEVGVDVNRCITHPHAASLIQFVCGLGPRKGFHLLKTLKQYNSRLENRTQLVTLSHVRMGPKVFINCAGFIKIDTKALAESNTDTYVEPLDSTRIHPETYDWARKMAVDALEYDDTAEDANPAGALEEILESPDRLKDLDLDAFAEELERQGYGAKQITLYDIRAELSKRYKDLRTPYHSPTVEELFNLLTKETPETFYIGKLITCRVTGIAHRRPNKEQLEVANPVRSDQTGLWQCPFCDKKDFPELSEVWNHFDTNGCPGQAVGVRTRLDNGVTGFIHVRNLSDKHITNPEERVQVGMTVHARITKINIDNFSVELTTKSSDLMDADNKWRLQRDPFYDYEAEDEEKKNDEEKRKQQSRQTYIKRVIAHPAFHNIDFKTCEKLMENMDQGDVIIRPSSKGADHLTLTWKVTNGILQHIDVREEGKENAFSLGRSLYIGTEVFEDLDEIIARYIQPMAAHARDILNYKYYVDCEGGRRDIMDELLTKEKRKQPSRIPYLMTASRDLPGKFLLSYLPHRSTRHEFVTVTPEGLRYRQRNFPSLGGTIRWFKDHYQEPIPGTPSSVVKTPGGVGALGGTPVGGGLHNVDTAAVQRAAAGLSSAMLSTLQQVAAAGQQTPYAGAAYGRLPGLTTPGSQFQNAGPVRQTPMPPRTPMMPPQTPSAYVGQIPPRTPGPSIQQFMSTPHPVGPSQWTAGAAPSSVNYTATPSQMQQVGAPIPVQQTSQRSSQDWARMAQQWAASNRSTDSSGRQPPATPRGAAPRTPRAGASPYTATPGGDATPLIDER